MKAFSILLVCLVSVIGISDAKVAKGNIRSTSDWLFVSRFCFDTEGLGNLTWTSWSQNTNHLLLLFYDDISSSWPAVYPKRSELSCEEKVAMAKGNRTIVNGQTHLQQFRDVERPHFWYVAVSNCGSSQKLEFEYQFEFINAGGSWTRQFSYDEQGLTAMYLTFWLVFLFITVGHLRAVWLLVKSNSYHPIIRLLTATILLETVALLCSFIHYSIYASNGVGANGMKGLGEILDIAAQLVFMFLLILFAKGWLISKPAITGQRALLVIVSVFLIGYISLITWENVGRDPASTLYIYESVPGIIILVVRFLTMCWFLWELRRSLLEETHPSKKQFYLILGGIGAAWFMVLILTVVVAALAASETPWNIAKSVTAVYLVFNTLGFASLTAFLWPSRTNKYFQVEQSDVLLGSAFHNSPYDSL